MINKKDLNDDYVELARVILYSEFESIMLYHDNYYIGMASVLKDNKDKLLITLLYLFHIYQ